MKKKYSVPATELVRVCGNANLLDNKLGNSGHATVGGQTGDDDDYDFQGSKPKWGDWDDDQSGKGNLWKD